MEWFGPLRSDDDRRRQFEPRKRLRAFFSLVWRYRPALADWIFYRRVDRWVLGFGGIAATASGICPIHFYVFLTLFAVSLLAHLLRGTRL